MLLRLPLFYYASRSPPIFVRYYYCINHPFMSTATGKVKERKELYERLAKRKSRDARSGFFGATQVAPRDTQRERRRRSATSASDLQLQLRQSQSQSQSQKPSSTAIPEKSTVRLVEPSTSSASNSSTRSSSRTSSEARRRSRSSVDDEHENVTTRATRTEPDESQEIARVRETSDASDPLPGSPASGREFDVSDATPPANEPLGTGQEQDRAPSPTLYPNTSQLTLARSEGHRRSTSSGWGSLCSTLQSGSEIALVKSLRSHPSSSLSTTLRGTPTPADYEHSHARTVSDETARLSLQTLQEASPELTTIRAVSDSETSITPSPPAPHSGPRVIQDPSTLAFSRPYTAPSVSSNESDSPVSLPRTSRRAYSTGSLHTLPSLSDLREVTSSPVVQLYGSEPATISDAAHSHSSSPNFVAYSPSVGSIVHHQRPISRPGRLAAASSFESITSRFEQDDETSFPGRRLASHSSWASLESTDTLPPLFIPRRRVRHKAASTSLSSQASSQATITRPRTATPTTDDTMGDDEDIDTLPFPRRPFSNQLSTIASESDGQRGSHHLSHWSLGSGVLTIGTGDQTPLSATFDESRRRSAPVDSIASSLPSPATRGTSVEAGDMTLGIFREESAVPQPLFKTQHRATLVNNPGPSSGHATRKYDGPLPPLPPVPQNGDEDELVDTLSEMTRPSLHQKRSGYSLRGKSNHSRQQSEISYVGSDRSSQSTGIFPVWARNFYSGQARLSSKLSLSSLSTTERARPAAQHGRGDSTWTSHSITSRLGQTYSSEENVSPTSSHFLPAIFRSGTRNNEGSRKAKLHKSQKSRGSKKSRPSHDDRPDSMPILADPLQQQPEATNEEVLPSGQPRWGVLQGSENEVPQRVPRHKPLRKYSKQNQWGEMEFPRPMTKDRLSDFNGTLASQPHLAPSKRISQNRLSFWQAPSFTESLDTLIRSRCNRQVLLFTLGFVLPLFWMLGAVLPLPKKPVDDSELEKAGVLPGSEEDVAHAMMRHEAGDAEQRWREDRVYRKAKWWRMLNRIMSVIGILVIAAVVRVPTVPLLIYALLICVQVALVVITVR